MNNNTRWSIAATLLLPVAVWAQTQATQAFGLTMSAQNPCRDAVSKFEQNIALVRHINGEKKATEFKARYLPPGVESNLLATEGYCGLAKYLRDRKLID